jgi:nitronate monooxygenase
MVSIHFGLPSAELLTQVRAYSKVISSAKTIEEARWLEGHGVDAIIAQGLEAGGHRGMFLSNDLTTQVGTFALLPQVVQAVKPARAAFIPGLSGHIRSPCAPVLASSVAAPARAA